MLEFHKGKALSEETKRKISISAIGKNTWTKGMKFPERSGEKHWNWKGGITLLGKIWRNSTKYKEWRKAVFKRDNYTCQICHQRGGKLNADHMKAAYLFPELRFNLDNGRTLCVNCHRDTETFGHRVKAL